MLPKARNRETHINQATASLSLRTAERVSQLPFPSNHSSRSSPLKFFASATVPKPDPPADPQKVWKAEFLKDLRSNRPVRPNGSRPQPDREKTLSPTRELETPLRTSSAMSGSVKRSETISPYVLDRCASAMSHRRVPSEMTGADGAINRKGRPLAQKPLLGGTIRDSSATTRTSMVTPSATYRESGHRWMEKQEARSLREALEDIDLKDEVSLHAAAQDEASELVWRHQNPHVPYKNPDAPYNYKAHLQKGSYGRSQSIGPHADLKASGETIALGTRLISEHSTSEKGGFGRVSSGSSLEYGNVAGQVKQNGGTSYALWDSPEKKAYMSNKFPVPPVKISGRRRSSGSRSGKVSGGLFRNPADQIFEEPEDVRPETSSLADDAPAPLQVKARNPISKLPTANRLFLRSGSVPAEGNQKLVQSDIHKNPPSQSRDPSYLQNTLSPTPANSKDIGDSEPRSGTLRQKNGMEIRSDDIRAATSMRLKDRSPKLPSPTVVSDRPGRPIVSFDKNWKPREINLKHGEPVQPRSSSRGDPDTRSLMQQPLKPQFPESTVSAPAIPIINFPEPPSIQVNDEPVSELPLSDPSVSSLIPSISIEDAPLIPRNLPTPTSKPRAKPPNRPLPSHSSTAPVPNSTSHWSPFPNIHRATAQCAACALPIAGRIVSASSQRFHPHCFTCHHCAALLEHVAFYPEPSTSRDSRLGRINSRANGEDVREEEGKTSNDDGDAGLRFFCHLDFHENFSPRCRSCKTPIEGEVVVACGGEWHVGHFFCAECGDPFDAKTPFVEREGYAWCVECHTKRFSGKCKGCRKPIVELVVRALGGEWHEGCFCCKVWF